MVEATQKNEAGTLNYEWAISDDRQICHSYERFQDSAAAMGPHGVVPRELYPAIHGSGEAHTPSCLWHTERTGEGCARRVEPGLHGAFGGLQTMTNSIRHVCSTLPKISPFATLRPIYEYPNKSKRSTVGKVLVQT
jgi:hypothetical protein